MGRRTFESIGRVLLNNTSIIITRGDYQFPELLKPRKKSKNALLFILWKRGLKKPKRLPARTILLFWRWANIQRGIGEKSGWQALFTVVDGDYNADTFFPGLFQL